MLNGDFIIPLREIIKYGREKVGGKAYHISKLIHSGFLVPSGFCITSDLYTQFIEDSKIKDFISYELGRKPLDSMRWEEIWDAALRIRNAFLKKDLREEHKREILKSLNGHLEQNQLVIRSSSNYEDSEINSYAGLHESFLNVSGNKDIIKHIRLVWASLWSDAAISYSKELNLDVKKGRMSVVIQEMIPGEVSGVAFGASPMDEKKIVIEAVWGLNKGLVDGDVEPDQWILAKSSGLVESYKPSKEKKKTISLAKGISVVENQAERGSVLSQRNIDDIYETLLSLEEKMGFVPDMEWTIHNKELYILQVRPISSSSYTDKDTRRGWDMTLRRTFHNLRELAQRITGEILPAMTHEADMMEKVNLDAMSDNEMAEEIRKRHECLQKWKGVYWDELIPFAHGTRLFGQIYNDRMSPEDPYEFVAIISTRELLSVKRNKMIQELAVKLGENPEFISPQGQIIESGIKENVRELIAEFPSFALLEADFETSEKRLAEFLRKVASFPDAKKKNKKSDAGYLEKKFLETFDVAEKKEAQELIDLAKLSYKLRDDDNVYLGRIETELSRAVRHSRTRLGRRCKDSLSCQAAEEVIRALREPSYIPQVDEEDKNHQVMKGVSQQRQMRGQPAGKGVARGLARVIQSRSDLFTVKHGEILVCESIDPEMTFVISIVGGIVEKRGGMLIHGAIIAREYGIPCVTGVENAASVIRTGDDITVDGYFGLVINHSVGEDSY